MPGSRCRSWRSPGSCCRAIPDCAGSETTALLGLAALLVSGASITVSLLYCKRLHDHGVNAEVVTSVRYVLLILIAAGVVWHKGGFGGIGTVGEAATLTALATILMVLPLYAFQVGIALTAPLTANVLRALGPVFVFALQQIDGRLTYSTPTLIGILAYSAAAIASNVAHARSEAPANPSPRVSARRLRLRRLRGGALKLMTLPSGHAARLPIDAALVGDRLEAVGQPDHRLGAAQHQEAVALGDAGDALEHADLGGLIEVDQHVAAQHQIEAAEMGEVVEQVERHELAPCRGSRERSARSRRPARNI